MWSRLLTLTVALVVAAASFVDAQQDPADIARLVGALRIAAGQTVAEIGAGGGSMAVATARVVGTGGRVFASELGADRLATLRAAVVASGLAQVTVVDGQPADGNLGASCCDAAYMRNVYHHFEDPVAMLRSLRTALKSGGRLAIIDFPPRSGGREATRPSDRDENASHGVTSASVTRELKEAGFDIVSTEEPGGDRWFMVVGGKP